MNSNFRNVVLSECYQAAPVEHIENPSGIIVVDVETTGLSEDDEILQLSVIDGEGNVLINEYIRPYIKKEWPDAQLIHKISPADVQSCPYAHRQFGKLKSVIASAHTYIGYNAAFDIRMLSSWGADFSALKIVDVMKDFAPIYGEFNEKYGTFKWQKLVTCAKYYGYEFRAHDSLEDVRATLYCYRKMQEQAKKNASIEAQNNDEGVRLQPHKKKKL